MWLVSFYRFYASLGVGVVAYFLSRGVAAGVACAIAFRLLLWAMERAIAFFIVNERFNRHVYEFKQQLGPYGIRMANMAQRDRKIKKSLSEVFTPNMKNLKKCVDELTMMDTLFRAGMLPDAETQQLHDCKLKYGTYRLERVGKKPNKGEKQ
jgi:hypothetical protein